ncbi:MAG: ABC transporter substrate-binding protein [Microbacterium sp.]
MNTAMSRAVAAGLVVGLAGLALTACGNRGPSDDGSGVTASPGITDDTITIGSSLPLSGPLSRNGETQLASMQAYFDALNEDGGVTMGDGKTRTVDFVYYDDAYDPPRLVQNFHRLVDQDQVFALYGMFGTASNLAAMPIATESKVPQVFLGTGAAAFSEDREANPYTLGWWPTYQKEAATFGEYLVSLDKPMTVAFLAQNDDQGEAYLAGLTEAIEGSKVKLVKKASYSPTDTVYDSQVSALAATKADALFSGVNVPSAQTAVLEKLGDLQWSPITYLPIVSAAPDVVREAGAGDFLDELYSGAFTKWPCSPADEGDDDVKRYREVMGEQASEEDVCYINTVFGWAMSDTLITALEQTKEPTRDAFMDAISQLKTEDIALIHDDLTFDGSETGEPPIADVAVRIWEGDDWTPADIG